MKAIVVQENKNIVNHFYKYGLYVLFILLNAVFIITAPHFSSYDNIRSVLVATAPLGLSVVGMTFVILAGGIDLSVGAIVFTSAMVAVMSGNAGLGFGLSFLFSFLAGVLAGFVNGFVISKWRLVPFLATLATMTLFRGIMLLFTGEGYLIHNDPMFAEIISNFKILGLPLTVYFFVLVAVVGQIILKKTPFGWHLYAMGNNYNAAKKIGINVRWHTIAIYTISGALSGLSGFAFSSMVGSVSSNFGTGQEFQIISATVLGGVSLFGGKGNILPGAIIGIFIFTIIEDAMVLMSANPYFHIVVRGVIIFIAVMLDCVGNKGELR